MSVRPATPAASAAERRPVPRRGLLRRGLAGLVGASRRLPTPALICAAVALANAVTFSLIVPPFQVPDEPEHYSYTEYIAQTGRLPHAPPPATEFSPQEQAALDGLYFSMLLGGSDFGRPVWSAAEAAHVRSLLAASPSRRGQGGVTGESDNPPLYYAAAVVPYEIASGGSFFDRLEAIRLFSALLSALTTFFVFCFVREVIPQPRWAATVAALMVALQPQVAFIAGGVNNDNLMFTAAAAMFWALARSFRRGLTPRRGAAIGACVAIGLLAKLTFIGLLPGAVIAVLLLCLRRGDDGSERTSARRGAAVAGLVAAVPVAAYVALNTTVWHRSLFGGALGAAGSVSGAPAGPSGGNLRQLLSYVWQFYLPRLPGMKAQFGFYPLWHVWFQGFIGRFGLLDYGFPKWVYYLALGIFALLLGLVVRELARRRRAVAARWREWLAYALIAGGLLAAIARAGFPYHLQTHFVFEQARYLFPLLALYGLFIAVALRGAGRRWGAALAGTLVVAALAHDLFAQLLTLQRYYT